MKGQKGGSAGRILVVDDNAQVCKLFKRILETGGYTVTVEPNGKNVEHIVTTEKVNLVVLDLDMPAPNGFETLKALRATMPGLRVLIVSGYLEGALLEAAMYVGAAATLSKADAPRKLLDTVNQLLKY